MQIEAHEVTLYHLYMYEGKSKKKLVNFLFRNRNSYTKSEMYARKRHCFFTFRRNHRVCSSTCPNGPLGSRCLVGKNCPAGNAATGGRLPSLHRHCRSVARQDPVSVDRTDDNQKGRGPDCMGGVSVPAIPTMRFGRTPHAQHGVWHYRGEG